MPQATLVPAEERTLGPKILGQILGQVPALILALVLETCLWISRFLHPSSLKIQTRWHRSCLQSVYWEKPVQQSYS